MKRSFVALAAAVLIAASPTAAHAAPAIDDAIAYALDAIPGGVATSPHSAEWPALGMRADTLTGRAVGSCATGNICAYSGAGQTGTRLSWTTCGSKSTAALAQVGSIANARSSGTLTALASSTVRATAVASAAADVALAYRASITSIRC